MTAQLETIDIPLNKLVAWNTNVRRTNPDAGLTELAASISSMGLLQSLVVKKEPKGKFAVIAGRRRLSALSMLASSGQISEDTAIPCRLSTRKDADPAEIGLAENVIREGMHPADEFEAFRRLIENGKSVADVAARFGVSEAVVSRRLALARVSPKLLHKYRAGEMNLDLLQAFTVTDDHTTQEELWDSLSPWDRTPSTVRRLLSKNDIPAHHKLVRFVGLSEYEQAGGSVRRDLFAEGEHGVFACDSALLQQMASRKLQALASTMSNHGWKWVEVLPDYDYRFVARMRCLQPETSSLSEEALVEVEVLRSEKSTLEDELEELDLDEDDENARANEIYDRLDAIAARLEAIENTRTEIYSPEVKQRSGVVVSISSQGHPEYICGLLRPEDEREDSATVADSSLTASPDEKCVNSSDGADPNGRDVTPELTDEEPALPATLVESLTQHKTAALAAELSQNPAVALAAVVHVLVLREFNTDLRLYRCQSAIQFSSTNQALGEAGESKAGQCLAEQRRSWLALLPREDEGLWEWCLSQDRETLLSLLAFCAAMSVNAVQTRAETEKHLRVQHANALATALGVSMGKWFEPGAENYFNRVSKPLIAAAMKEAGRHPNLDPTKLKKSDLAAMAEDAVKGSGWLPKPLRVDLSGAVPR
jgi:ParB family transcriptional regulator, chromosome partitioning protein